MSELAKPWFGITMEEGKYSIISVPVYDYLSCVVNNDFSTQQQIMKRYGISNYEFRKAFKKIRKERPDIFA